MISRLSTCAALFSVFAAVSLTYAAGAKPVAVTAAAPVVSAKPVRIVQLERVVIVAKRLPAPAL